VSGPAPHVSAVGSLIAFVWTHLAQVSLVIQILVGIATLGAMTWSMFASHAKKRAYDDWDAGKR